MTQTLPTPATTDTTLAAPQGYTRPTLPLPATGTCLGCFAKDGEACEDNCTNFDPCYWDD